MVPYKNLMTAALAAGVLAMTTACMPTEPAATETTPEVPQMRTYDSVEEMVEALKGSQAECLTPPIQVPDINDLGLADQRVICESAIGELWLGKYLLPQRRDEEMMEKGWRQFAWGDNWIVQVKTGDAGRGAQILADTLGGIAAN